MIFVIPAIRERMTHRHREILLVEDNPADQALCREAFSELGSDILLTIAGSGPEALRILEQRREGLLGSALPSLLLLDIQLPGISGLEVLSRVRADPALTLLPVLILTTSQHLRDVQEAYRLRANAYLVKPFDYEDLRRLMQRTVEFWLDSVVAPAPVQAEA